MDLGTAYFVSVYFIWAFELWTVYLRVITFDWVPWQEKVETKRVADEKPNIGLWSFSEWD